MKIIRDIYETLAEVHCSCCMESHTLRLDVCGDYGENSKDALYLSFKDHNKFSLFNRIKNSVSFIKDWKSYINGDNVISCGVIISNKQLIDIYSVLIEGLLRYGVITPEDLEYIEKIEYNPFDVIDDSTVFYTGGNIIVSGIFSDSKFTNITLGYRLDPNTELSDVLRTALYHTLYGYNYFIGGDYEEFMDKKSTVEMLKVFYYIINDLNKQ